MGAGRGWLGGCVCVCVWGGGGSLYGRLLLKISVGDLSPIRSLFGRSLRKNLICDYKQLDAQGCDGKSVMLSCRSAAGWEISLLP